VKLAIDSSKLGRAARRGARVALLGAVFAAGYLFATVTQPTAQAQYDQLGKKAMEAAGKSGGSLGAAADLGTSITEMRDHVTALNADLDKLEKIKAALGGG